MPKKLTQLARHLRNNPTPAEQKLWYFLRRRKLNGFRFQRQVAIEKYIVDFMCFEIKVIIELDGGQHTIKENLQQDIQRTAWLELQGYIVKRYWNDEILLQHQIVLNDLLRCCNQRAEQFAQSPSLTLPRVRGRGQVHKSPGTGEGKSEKNGGDNTRP